MWSRILDSREISLLASGCGVMTVGDVDVSPGSKSNSEERTVENGECTVGRGKKDNFVPRSHTDSFPESDLLSLHTFLHTGFRLTCRKNYSSPVSSVSTLLSPWMTSDVDRVRGTCMNFTYGLLGIDSQLDVWIEARNMNKERLWSVKSLSKNNLWKTGQVSLGLFLEFRVSSLC